ncbi:MAG: gliding motility-associated C-terminal domain-containing protein [Bacteroidota bacterium]
MVKVTQNSGCFIVNEIPFVINSVVIPTFVDIPNLITPNGDEFNNSWNIPDEYTNNQTKVLILDANGEVVFTTDNYENYFNIDGSNPNNWPNSNNPVNFKSVNPVYYYIMTTQSGKVKKGSITIVK